MTRLEEMAKAGYSAACKREKVRELPWADVRERGWISDARVMVERLIEIGNGSAAVNGFLAGILTEHDRETSQSFDGSPERPQKP